MRPFMAAVVFVLTFFGFIFVLGDIHEHLHQEIYMRGCESVNSSIHLATPREFIKDGWIMYLNVSETHGCRPEVWALNVQNEIVGYQTIFPFAFVIALLAAVLVRLE